jgi:DnaJ-class molecular chaperone
MSKIHTHYDNLKISRNAPNSVIRAAYKTLMQQYHPDKYDGDKEEALRICKLIQNSYEVLIDPVKRGSYN